MSKLVFDDAVLLVGGGEIDAEVVALTLPHAPHVVAADGGADALAAFGLIPEAVIGDMDSISDIHAWAARGVRLMPFDEQETTDLEKCLYATEAPLYLGVGFTGRRFDHTLAALHALMRWRAKRVILLGAEDAIFMAPQAWQVALPADARVSFFPMAPVRGLASDGLAWPVDGLDFAPGLRIGTSNRAIDGPVSVRFNRPDMAAMVARQHLAAVIDSLH